MKCIAFSKEELNQLISTLYKNPFGRIGFCEELEVDIIEWYDNNFSTILDVTHFGDLLQQLNQHFNVSIKNYTVMELGEFGISFVFRI